MAVYPGALNMLIPRGTIGGAGQQSRIKPTIIILHTNASNTSIAGAASLMKNTTKGQEFHFQQEASGSGRVAGRLAQFVDTTIRADNNLKANSFTVNGVLCGAISVETADHGSPYTASWTDLGQRKNLEDLVVWLCKTHNIPARRCPGPFETGIGYHSMWGYNTSNNMNVNPWTNAVGKICPGPGKIGEFNDLLASVARRVAGGIEEDDLPTPKEVWDHVVPPLGDLPSAPAWASLQDARSFARFANDKANKTQLQTDTLEGTVGSIATQVAELGEQVAALIAKVDALEPGEGGSVDVAAVAKAVNDEASRRLAS